MKKYMLLICVLLFLVVLFGCGATENETSRTDTSNTNDSNQLNDGEEGDSGKEKAYTVLLHGFSDSIPNVSHVIEYRIADYEKFKDITPDKQTTVSLNGESYLGTYVESFYSNYEYFPTHSYSTSEGYLFRVNEKGDITFFRFDNSSAEEKLSKDECVEKGRNFIENFLDTSSYNMTVEDHKYGYELLFTKYIDGIKTSDFASIVVQHNGDLFRYYSNMLGRVPANANTENIDLEKAKMAVYERIDKIYSPVKDLYSRVEYGEPEFIFTMLSDEEFGIICNVEIDFIHEYGEYEQRIGELLTFVIPLQK